VDGSGRSLFEVHVVTEASMLNITRDSGNLSCESDVGRPRIADYNTQCNVFAC
jgi:hypothetical protein